MRINRAYLNLAIGSWRGEKPSRTALQNLANVSSSRLSSRRTKVGESIPRLVRVAATTLLPRRRGRAWHCSIDAFILLIARGTQAAQLTESFDLSLFLFIHNLSSRYTRYPRYVAPLSHYIIHSTFNYSYSLSLSLASQVYNGLDIVTAKVTPAERQMASHHMLDVVDPLTNFSVIDFRDMALPIVI